MMVVQSPTIVCGRVTCIAFAISNLALYDAAFLNSLILFVYTP